MGRDGYDKELNSFEKQLEEIIEEQRNVNNPGYFIGSGKASLFLRNFFKSPIIMLIAGIIFSIPVIYDLICNFNIYIIYNNLFSILISTILITGGILRLKKRN